MAFSRLRVTRIIIGVIFLTSLCYCSFKVINIVWRVVLSIDIILFLIQNDLNLLPHKSEDYVCCQQFDKLLGKVFAKNDVFTIEKLLIDIKKDLILVQIRIETGNVFFVG